MWATAFYAGLRLGELWALRDEDVDLELGVIRVERSWDRRDGVIEPKSRAGRRAVPVVAALRSHLAARKLRRRDGGALFFGDGSRPFNRDGLVARAAQGVEGGGAGADRPPRVPAHVRVDPDRGRRERESALDLPRPQLDPDHARPLRAPNARETRTRRSRSSTPTSNAATVLRQSCDSPTRFQAVSSG